MAKRVLIADDNDEIRLAVRRMLEAQGTFEVCGEAVDGKDAIAKAELLNPDLMLLDLSMPVMNGIEAAGVLREKKPALPIILFTLHASPALQSEAAKLGIRAVVSKTEINALINQVLAVFKSTPLGKASRLGN